MAKIGFLGGTFNPIHNGHLYLADSAYKALSLDKVLIVPSGISYFKVNEDVLPKEVRSEMTKLAISDYPYFEFSDIEITRDGNTYTYETLLELADIYKDDQIFFIAGADTLFSIESWKKPDVIFENCTLAVMNRDNSNLFEITEKCNYYFEKYKARTVIIDVNKIDISSTHIRELIHNGCFDELKNMIPDNVFEYIIKNNLYRG